jgi:hypothetical protein
VVPYSPIFAYLPLSTSYTCRHVQNHQIHSGAMPALKQSQPLRNLTESPHILTYPPAHMKRQRSTATKANTPPHHPPPFPELTATRATSSMRRAEEMSGAQKALRRPTRRPALNAHHPPLRSFMFRAPLSLWLNTLLFRFNPPAHCPSTSNFRTCAARLIRRVESLLSHDDMHCSDHGSLPYLCGTAAVTDRLFRRYLP